MRKIYVLLIFCLLILSVFISCDDKSQGVELVTITLDSGILKEEAKTIETAEGQSVILPSGDNLWSTSGYTFSGWAETATGIDKYKAGDKYSSSKSIMLYAVWVVKENKATITYSSNGGSGTISSVSVNMGTEVTLDKGSSLSRGGYFLDSWNTSSDGKGTTYGLGDKLKLTKDMTLYAVWTENYNIKYYSYNEDDKEYELIAIEYPQSGGTVTVYDGNGLSKDGNYALYWTTTQDPNEPCTSYDIGEEYTVKESVSLYAQWQPDDGSLKYTLHTDDAEKYYSVKASDTKTISGEITIPDTYKGKDVTAIEDLGFEKCTGITKVTIPESVTSIGCGAFYGCTALTSVKIPEEVKELKAYNTEDYCAGIFEGCSALKTIEIPSSVTEIGYCSFRNCISLETINIPGDVTLIGGNAFEGCPKLASVLLPEKVTKIGGHAFSESGLTSIEIPSSVIEIGTYAFDKCNSLKAIYLNKEYKEITDEYKNRWGAPERCTVTLKPTQVGDTMELGTYTMEVGTYKAVTWKCIQIKDNKALMISDKVLGTQAFDNKSRVYANSDIRKYLTSEDEGNFIKTYYIDTSKMLSVDLSSATETISSFGTGDDKLFLLSKTEVENIWPTNTAVTNRVVYSLSDDKTAVSWWLRSPEKDIFIPENVYYVYETGYVKYDKVEKSFGVRPAFWMSLE